MEKETDQNIRRANEKKRKRAYRKEILKNKGRKNILKSWRKSRDEGRLMKRGTGED